MVGFIVLYTVHRKIAIKSSTGEQKSPLCEEEKNTEERLTYYFSRDKQEL